MSVKHSLSNQARLSVSTIGGAPGLLNNVVQNGLDIFGALKSKYKISGQSQVTF